GGLYRPGGHLGSGAQLTGEAISGTPGLERKSCGCAAGSAGHHQAGLSAMRRGKCVAIGAALYALAVPLFAQSNPAVKKEALNSFELSEVQHIRDRILANKSNPSGTKAYKIIIPNTTVSYEMVAIPAGEYTMGSQAKKDEQPPHKVTVSGFWMQAHEITWDEYRLFMFANQAGEIAHKDDLVDGVSRPRAPTSR